MWVFEHIHGYFCKTRLFCFTPYGREEKETKKRTGRVSENAAKEDLGEEGEAAGCNIPKRLKRLRRFGELSNTQRHPPLELDEHEKDTEMQGDQGGGTFENEQEPRDAPQTIDPFSSAG